MVRGVSRPRDESAKGRVVRGMGRPRVGPRGESSEVGSSKGWVGQGRVVRGLGRLRGGSAKVWVGRPRGESSVSPRGESFEVG